MIRDGKNYFRCEDEFLVLVLQSIQRDKTDNSIDFFIDRSNSDYGESEFFIEETSFKRLLDCKKILSQMTYNKLIRFLESDKTPLSHTIDNNMISNLAGIQTNFVTRGAIKLYHLPDNLFESYINEYYLLIL